jgi:hypothetical protein
MDEHPGIARVPIANIPTGENALHVTDSMIAVMQAGGLSDQVTAWACDILSLYVTAVCFENQVYAEKSDPAKTPQEAEAAMQDQLAEEFSRLSPERYPHVVALMPALAYGSGEERFEFGVDVLLDGLIAQSRNDAP